MKFVYKITIFKPDSRRLSFQNMEAVGSLQSILADYGLGDSDIEDSDEEKYVNTAASSVPVVQPRVKSSSRLVSYDDLVEEEEEELQLKQADVALADGVVLTGISVETSEVEDTVTVSRPEEDTIARLSKNDGNDKESENTEWRLSKIKVELPPEPSGRCSNKLQDKITRLLEKKHKENIDLNANVQNRKLFRNPSIYEKLVKHCSINETGTNYPETLFDINSWTEESFYDNLSKAQKEAYEKKEKEKLKGRTQVEFVSGTKKSTSVSGEEGKKRKSKWDVSASGVPIKPASPAVNKITVAPSLPVIIPVVKAVDSGVTAAKKPKLN